MDEFNIDNLTKNDFEIIGRRICEKLPLMVKSLIQKPSLTNLEEVYDVIAFLEIQYNIDQWGFWTLPFKERNEFFRMALPVICFLYDPEYMAGHKKLLVRGLRDKLASIFNTSPSNVSGRIKQAIEQLLVYPFFSKDVYFYVNQYLKERKK